MKTALVRTLQQEVDSIVFELYGLNWEERKVIIEALGWRNLEWWKKNYA